MKTISETIVTLYYDRPNSQDKEFLCTCESEEVALEEIHRLRIEWPDAYPEPSRFITKLIRYVRRAY